MSFAALLDPVYYAVSAVMWAWHRTIGALLGPADGVAWALSVVLLVVTLRALLLRLALAQLRSAAVLRRISPHLAALRARHADDPARLLRETGALQREHGVSTRRTLVPALLQLPVFLGLLHVLQGFRAGAANYAFGPAEVASFLDARLDGVPLSAYVAMPEPALAAFGIDRLAVVAVAVPLMLAAAVATHLTARWSLARGAADGPAGAILRWSPWIFPIGAIVGGLLFPFSVGVLLYWLTSNLWTLGQQRWGTRCVEGATATAAPAAAPRPGAIPDGRSRRGRTRAARRRT